MGLGRNGLRGRSVAKPVLVGLNTDREVVPIQRQPTTEPTA